VLCEASWNRSLLLIAAERSALSLKIPYGYVQCLMRLMTPGVILLSLLVITVVRAQVIGDMALPATDESYLNVVVEHGRVTLTAENVRTQYVLDELARQNDMTIVQNGFIKGIITLEFERQPLALALNRLLRDEKYLLHQAQSTVLWILSDELTVGRDSTMPLEAELMHGDVRARKTAVRGLRSLESQNAIASLSLALADEDQAVRIQAIQALARIGGDDALVTLASVAADDDAWVRGEAVNALASIGGESSVRYLALALNDEAAQVRASVVEALADIAGEPSLNLLSAALNDPDPGVRIAAVEALEEAGGDIAAWMLNHAATDQDPEVREAFDEARERLGLDTRRQDVEQD